MRGNPTRRLSRGFTFSVAAIGLLSLRLGAQTPQATITGRVVAAGTYAENVTVSKPLTLTGAGSSQTTISGSSGYGISLGAGSSGTTISDSGSGIVFATNRTRGSSSARFARTGSRCSTAQPVIPTRHAP